MDLLEALLGVTLRDLLLPLFRVAGLIMVAPVLGSRLVPGRAKIVLALAVAVLIAPTLPASSVEMVWPSAALYVARETLIGVAMAFTVQMVFDALVIAGQTIAMSMGLGFAMLIDPQRGVSVPVLSQFFLILGILVFLSLDGHLALLRMLAFSFHQLPVGGFLSSDDLWALLGWGSTMFAGALGIALPAVVSLLVVNIGFGVMSRAAPTLNLFALGFPAALLLGFLILLVSIDGFQASLGRLLDTAFLNLDTMFTG